jgi:hypothetical protein
MADRKQSSRAWVLLAGVALASGMVLGLQFAARRQVVHHSRASAAEAIAALPEQQAKLRVRELLPLDADAIGVIVPLLADQREPVAAAASDAIRDLLTRWSRLPTEQSSPRIERLTRELAAVAPSVPSARRDELHALAARLLVWPLDADTVNAPQVLASCEAVLRLPLQPDDEPRIAAKTAVSPVNPAGAPAGLPADPVPAASPPALTETPAAELPPAPEPPPFYGRPAEPERLIDASRERPEEPRQLRAPRAIKIDG